MTPSAEDEQVFVVELCDAVALQLAPPVEVVASDAVTVTFCEGRKPCAEPLPEKYTPFESAA